jgi:hypothetical protein
MVGTGMSTKSDQRLRHPNQNTSIHPQKSVLLHSNSGFETQQKRYNV